MVLAKISEEVEIGAEKWPLSWDRSSGGLSWSTTFREWSVCLRVVEQLGGATHFIQAEGTGEESCCAW